MTRQRTSAEIEAGARAIYQNRSQTRWAWEELEPKQREHFLAVAQDTLAAADAAAAPAVGVSELNEAIEKVRHAARVAGATGYDWAISAERSACQDLFALLTAQPEPGMGGEKYRKIADAVARSVVPPDCVVVRRDDLVRAIDAFRYMGRDHEDNHALDRLRALIGDE